MHKKDNHIFIRVHAFPGENLALRFLFLALTVCILGYVYFVSVSIMNVIAHKEALAASESLQGEVGDLEEQYFALSKNVTPESGVHLGMTPTSDTTFVRRPGTVGTAVGSRADI